MSQKYEVKYGALTLPPGIVVRLTDAQAAVRSHAIKKRKDGAHDVLLPIQFKIGETLAFDSLPSKDILSAFFSVEKLQEKEEQSSVSSARPANSPKDKSTANKPLDTKESKKE